MVCNFSVLFGTFSENILSNFLYRHGNQHLALDVKPVDCIASVLAKTVSHLWSQNMSKRGNFWNCTKLCMKHWDHTLYWVREGQNVERMQKKHFASVLASFGHIQTLFKLCGIRFVCLEFCFILKLTTCWLFIASLKPSKLTQNESLKIITNFTLLTNHLQWF